MSMAVEAAGGSMKHFYHTLDEIFQSAESEDSSFDGGMITMNLCVASSSPCVEAGQRQQPGDELLVAYNTDIGPALRRNINAWCQATGLPTSITVHVQDRVFKLHKYPLVSRSGYFKKVLQESKVVKLPSHYPGGPDVFQLVVNFCYGSTILMDPSNVAALRCAAQFLDMSEEHGRGNLCERSDVYLTQVALQSWEDTLVVLLQCHALLPLAEEVQIVARCIDALAYMACTELLEPGERRDRPGTTNETLFWRDMSARRRQQPAARDWWVKDLLCLPCHLFQPMVAAMRRQGMQERQVTQVLIRYAHTHIIQQPAAAAAAADKTSKPCQQRRELVEALVCLLPLPQLCTLPLAFLFALLRCALPFHPQSTSAARLETLIAAQLECAGVKDYLLPPGDEVVESMQRIVALFLAAEQHNRGSSAALNQIAQVWDQYLAEIATGSTLSPTAFSELADTIPTSARLSHDLLYSAIHRYLKAHPRATEEERADVCRLLNCQRLSQDVCAHAVQNELMPLRMLVQAMFLQQLQTRNTLCHHLHSVSVSGRMEVAGLQPLGTAPSSFRRSSVGAGVLQQQQEEEESSSFRWRDEPQHQHPGATAAAAAAAADPSAHRQAVLLKADFEATYSRLRHLEEELARMRQNLEDTCQTAGTASPRVETGGGAPAVRDSHGEQAGCGSSNRKDGLAGGCLGHSGLVLRVSKSIHKLALLGYWKGRTSTGGNTRDAAPAPPPADSPSACTASLRSSSMRCPHPDDSRSTGAGLTSGSNSLRWTSPSSFSKNPSLSSATSRPRGRRRSMSADMS